MTAPFPDLERVVRVYFSDPAQRMSVPKGGYLMRQGQPNGRMFRVLSGSFAGCTRIKGDWLDEDKALELFRVEPGGFLGVHSFFSASGLASFDVIADSDGELAWIDRQTTAVDAAEHGSLKEQLFPIILNEMDTRQIRFSRAAIEREAYLRRLRTAEDMANLGRFAAGLAHELNNAIGVLSSAADSLCSGLDGLFEAYDPRLAPWFRRGAGAPHDMPSAEVRSKARALARKHGMEYEAAKDLVRMTGGEALAALPPDHEAARPVWAAGKNCYDIRFAASHAASVIHSIKRLSSGGRGPRTLVNVRESLHESLTLLRNLLRNIEVSLELDPDLPDIPGNKSEFMQIWLNIIKNAHEALRDANTPDPAIRIQGGRKGRDIRVRISNNGPPVSPAMREKLFQPSITSKSKSGGSMGLGLGLYIVKRLIDSYDGRIELAEPPGDTCFVICLPAKEPAPVAEPTRDL